jgi:hypothetical protein
MTDLELLREALRERESSAPDPTTVLAKTKLRLRRRRNLRRAAGLTGAVALTAAALVGIVAIPVTPATGPVAEPANANTTSATSKTTRLKGALLPFTVGDVPADYHLSSWANEGEGQTVQYLGDADYKVLTVGIRYADPAGGSATATTVGGKPAKLRTIAANPVVLELSWEIVAGHWIRVNGTKDVVGEQTLRQIAESVTATPSTVGATLEVEIPAGLPEESSTGDPLIGQFFYLCPADAGEYPGQRCATVRLRSGTALRKFTVGGPNGESLEIPLIEQEVDGVTLAKSSDGHIVARQLDNAYWISVDSTQIDPVVLQRLATTAKLGG